MRKVLITSITMLLISGLTFADKGDIDISGQMRGDIRYTNQGSTPEWSYNDLNARLTFKGNYPIISKIKALFFIETQIDVDTTTTGNMFVARDIYGGIHYNKIGKLLWGRISSPYKQSTAWLETLADTLGDYNLNIFTLDPRVNNSFVFESDKRTYWGGHEFIVKALTSAGETAGSGDGLFDLISFALQYSWKDLSLSGSWRKRKREFAGTSSFDSSPEAWKFSASYIHSFFKNHKTRFTAIFSQEDLATGNLANAPQDRWWLNVTHYYMKWNFMVNYGKKESIDDPSGALTTNEGKRETVLAVVYHFNPKASAHFIFRNVDHFNDTSNEWNTALGAIWKFD